MSELRQNLATKEWVVIAPERGERPDGLKTKISSVPLQGNEYEPDCPFCPGNEKKIPVIEKYRIDDASGKWIVRVVDNKYKILDTFKSCPLVPEPFEKDGIYQRLEGCGSHELVIETNKHNKRITDLSKEEVRDVVSAYIARYKDFKNNPNNLITIIFKNYGALAGQSQPHSHTQIVGSRVVPLYTRSLLHEAERYFDTYGSCVLCDMLKYEIKEKKRVVYQNDDYASFVPYAAGAEHETWILPKWHDAGLSDIEGKKLDNLSDILQTILKKFLLSINNPDFNFVIRTAPYPMDRVPFYHWFIQFLPRTKILGGFERGTRIQVNTIPPELSAKMLRECRTC